MAKITGLKERQLALSEIEAKLRLLENINLFLQTENTTGEYNIKFDKIRTCIVCEDKTQVNNLVASYKNTIAKAITDLAEQYSIELDQEDIKLINEIYVPDRKSTKISK